MKSRWGGFLNEAADLMSRGAYLREEDDGIYDTYCTHSCLNALIDIFVVKSQQSSLEFAIWRFYVSDDVLCLSGSEL
jgi:hypothetical protein